MRNHPDAVMLFAAGHGTRMGALTETQAKPMIPVAGRPLIDHALALLERAPISRRVANVHHMPTDLMAHLGARDVQISDERDALLETGGGLRKALPLLGDGPVFTLNTDAVWHGPPPIEAMLAQWDPARMDALLLCVPMARVRGHSGSGDFTIAPDGRLDWGPDTVYTGLQIIKTDRLHNIADAKFSLKVLWLEMLKAGTLYGMEYGGHWCDVGMPDGMIAAEAMLREVQDV